MADNMSIGGHTVAADEIDSAKYQRLKMIFGADGSNDGDVDDALPLPVSAAPRTDVVQNANTQLTPKFAVINTATGADLSVVAAVTGKRIRVLSLYISLGGTSDLRFESGAAGTALTGIHEFVAQGSWTLPFNPVGWFQTVSGEALSLEVESAVSVDGFITYVEV